MSRGRPPPSSNRSEVRSLCCCFPRYLGLKRRLCYAYSMKITAIEVRDYPPIKHFAVSDLSDVVVIGGPNGVGKTKLQEAILQKIRTPRKLPNVRLVIASTTKHETTAWGGKATLDTSIESDAIALQKFLQRTHKRARLRAGFLNFDSSRSFQTVNPFPFSFEAPDPFEEDIGWDLGLRPLSDRFTDTVHSMYRKVRSQRADISQRAIDLHAQGKRSMELDFADPLVTFKSTFARLLPGKELVALDERSQTLQFRSGGAGPFPISALSSGEREVISIVFDFLLRDPADSVILFDEPEVHLHPELSYRLLHTLREAGERNQFLYCTHSAEIIGASLDQTVVFVRPADGDKNQAVLMAQESEAGEVLQLLGQSLGIISLGRRIVLIEGDQTSLDKQTYGAILKTAHPDLVLVPAGGRENLETFAKAIEAVLNKSVWGVDFFALCDGDASIGRATSDAMRQRTNGRIRTLPRYHLENYFLDAEVLARVFVSLEEPAGSWLCDPASIDARLRELAARQIPYAAALRVAHGLRHAAGNVDVMPSGCDGKDAEELEAMILAEAALQRERITSVLDPATISTLVREEHARLDAALARPGDDWKDLVPGRPILNSFAKAANLDRARLKNLYLKEARGHVADPFAAVRAIFASFAGYGREPTQRSVDPVGR
jgi:hypothetical protein